jgi:hypothetical protein
MQDAEIVQWTEKFSILYQNFFEELNWLLGN